MCNIQNNIYSLDEFIRKYKFIPKPVITQDHKWMIDEYIWYCTECNLEIGKPSEIREEIFDKALPILKKGNYITYISSNNPEL